jgi:hypothetical protein
MTIEKSDIIIHKNLPVINEIISIHRLEAHYMKTINKIENTRWGATFKD